MDAKEKYARLLISGSGNCKFQDFMSILEKYGSISDYLDSGRINGVFDMASLVDKAVNSVKENSFIVYGEQAYPKILKEIPSPPIALFYKGDLSLLESPNMISIVGTRKNSPYGERVTASIVTNLSRYSYVFVSGMALGIDSIVHRIALKAGAKTIAVLPSPIHSPAPRSNLELFQEIAREGLVISECVENSSWNKQLYARRNRIIAGLSPITLVIEAPKKSGALITANLAFEYNREVYAVPGSIESDFSAGCNSLIKENKAHLFSQIDDIIPSQYKLEVLDESSKGQSNQANAVINLLSVEQLSFEELCRHVSIDRNVLQNILLELELKQLICLNNNGKYNIKSNLTYR